MGKDNDNGDSQFGFKDRAKAEETLKLLEKHDLQYRKLTVRGLLGRAKRVLTLTKAEEKIKNIKEAMSLFEEWLEENGGAANKNSKPEDDKEKVDTVPGLGFKDKEAAEQTLKILEGRDPDYQKLAVKGLIGSSKRVLSGTKNEDKIAAIKEGVQLLEDFLETFDKENRSKDNMAYLPHNIIVKLVTDLEEINGELVTEFIAAYGGDKANGNYKHLRTLYPKDDDSISWDIIRNQNLKELKEELAQSSAPLFDEDGAPTEIHLKLISWAYSPQPDKVKSYVAKNTSIEPPKSKTQKRKSSAPSSDSDKSSSDDAMEDDDDDDSNNDEDAPAKKRRAS